MMNDEEMFMASLSWEDFGLWSRYMGVRTDDK